MVAGGVESMSMVPMTGNKLSASPEAMDPATITAANITLNGGGDVAITIQLSQGDQIVTLIPNAPLTQ